MATRTRTLAPDRTEQRFKDLVEHPQSHAGVQRSRQFPHAAGHHHQERLDDVVLSHVGRDAADQRQAVSGDPGQARSQGERAPSMRRVLTPKAAAMSRFCVVARIRSPNGV